MTPVVGIALLLALTVLIAATVAAFVFTMEDEAETSEGPRTAFAFEYEPHSGGHDAVTIVHKSGDAIDASNLYFRLEGAACEGSTADPKSQLNVRSDYTGVTGDVTAGMSFLVGGSGPTICPSGDLDLRDATIRVVWISGGGTSRELQTWHGPG